MPSPDIPVVIDTVIRAVGIIYWARFFTRTGSQLSTNTRCSSPITIINLVHSIFHVVRLGIKREAGEHLTSERLGRQSIRDCTMMKARIYCFLCMKAVKKSTVGVQKRPLHLYQLERCQSSLRECIAIGACNCLPYSYLWKSLQLLHLAVIAGHIYAMTLSCFT